MSYRVILVHIDDTPRAPLRLDVALRLAQAHAAKLVGMYLVPSPDLTSFPLSMIPPEVIETRLQAEKQARDAAETMFREATAHSAIESVEWRAPAGDARQAAIVHARYADLSILGQPARDEYDHAFSNQLANGLLMESGRPVLFVPFIGTHNAIATRVMIGWKDSREASRAVCDAMPFLETAQQVNAVLVRPKDEAQLFEIVAEKQLHAYLARHKIRAKVKHIVSADVNAGEMLLSEAADENADLIVIGGYSRSRFAELVWGGVTRTMLKSMTVPVLMSH
jgi:nucleotide-binding universal stress UspA family protein